MYFGGIWGSPCWSVLTVSRECMSMSPLVPPRPPASMHWKHISSEFCIEYHRKTYVDIGRPSLCCELAILRAHGRNSRWASRIDVRLKEFRGAKSIVLEIRIRRRPGTAVDYQGRPDSSMH